MDSAAGSRLLGAIRPVLPNCGCRRAVFLAAVGESPVECSGCDHCTPVLAVPRVYTTTDLSSAACAFVLSLPRPFVTAVRTGEWRRGLTVSQAHAVVTALLIGRFVSFESTQDGGGRRYEQLVPNHGGFEPVRTRRQAMYVAHLDVRKEDELAALAGTVPS